MIVDNSVLATVLNKESIGERLRKARKEAGLSQGEMARHLGYKSPASVANKEKGLAYPSVLDLHYLSFYSGLSIDWIVSGSDSSTRGNDPLGTPDLLSEEEAELVRQYRAMSDKLRTRFAFELMRMKDEPDEADAGQ
jgi:transcriptional regulator with XRE-family HTH domain